VSYSLNGRGERERGILLSLIKESGERGEGRGRKCRSERLRSSVCVSMATLPTG